MFDLPGTVWYSGDGFSDGEGKNGFFIGRIPDTRPIPPEHDDSEPYNDLLTGILEDIILSKGMITADRLPPAKTDEKGVFLPDFVLHFSGDDDCTSDFYNINAAEVMNSLGLPYHINVMPGGDSFVIDSGDVKRLRELGCEIALHSDFTVQPYSAKGQKASCDLFEKNFGFPTLTNTNHCFIQSNMNAERLRWLGECGVIADNSKCGEVYPGDINAFNLCGFAFGTSFPRYTLDDAEHGNTPLNCMEIPVNYYEPRLDLSYVDEKSYRYSDTGKITDYIDRAAQEGRIAQFFIHPHYFAPDSRDMPAVIAALRLIMKHCGDMGYAPLFTTTDNIAKFWQSRAKSRLEYTGGMWIIETPIPLAIRLPHTHNSAEILLDGEPAVVINKIRSGREVSFVSVDSGRHTLEISKRQTKV